ncbi:FtsX family ABC transporter permease [Streptomyces sp. AM 2-1-1]|uniref:ABC transporter permease n=1 Tax=Streptomyces sp. AM 2-1-1 TaxID=3028709 RepID=UPI0023B93049|nr:FtsX family ABC transporter permease [Streptomyces sp. AM 2-1-1]WEH40161.1 FtsX-like permease family protein [Streptomyces sp. AM 2-1-1]
MTVWKTSLRNFLAHKGRMALSAVAVLLSVAFVCGTLVFTDTMNTTFDKLFTVSSPDVSVGLKAAEESDAEPDHGKPQTMPASVLAQVGKAEGVKDAEGQVTTLQVTLVDSHDKNLSPDTGAPTIAGNWTRNDLRSMKISSGHAPRGPTEMMIDAGTADKHGLELGDELRTITAAGDLRAKIVGIAEFTVTNPGAAVAYFDTATAQEKLLGRPDAYSMISVTAEKGVSDQELKANVAAALGDTSLYTLKTQAESAEDSKDSMGSFLNVMKYAMLGFAGIAFLVGIFLIVNTFSMLVAQRTRELGLMRAIGSSRRQVNRSVLVEALLLGIVGSALGVAAGVGLAVGLMQLMGAVGMELSTDDLTVAWTTPVVGLALGIIVTVLAAYVPARRAGKVSPMAALRDAGTPADGQAGRVRAALGIVLTGAGAAALWATARADEASDGSYLLGAGVVLTLIGFIVIGPLLAGVVVRGLSAVLLRLFGPVGRLAERNALRNPRRTGATGAALMIGLALVACLSVVGASMVASVTDELDKSVGADFIVQTADGQPIVPQAAKAVEAVPGLEHVTHYAYLDATVTSPDGGKDDEGLVAADPSYQQDVHREVLSGDLAAAYSEDSVSVGGDYAEKHGVKVGDTLTVAFRAGGTARLKVAAITSDDTSIDGGAKYISRATAAKHIAADQLPDSLLMFAQAKDGQEKTAYAALKKALAPYPVYQPRNQADYKEDLKDQVGQLLNIVYGLLALAIVVAVLGVVNTLALSVVERTREIGLLRAIGLSRRQLRRMIRLESVVIALFGALLGLGLGMGWGASAQQLLALEGLNALEIPWATIITVFVASAFVGLFAALVPAFRAGRMNVLTAIATDG